MATFCCQVVAEPRQPKLGCHSKIVFPIIVVCNYNVELIVGRVLPETPQCFPNQSILFPPPTYTYFKLQYMHTFSLVSSIT